MRFSSETARPNSILIYMPDPFAATAATNNLGVGGRIPGLIRASYSNVTTGNHAVFSADEILARDRHGLTRGLAEHVCDPREEERVRHSVLSLLIVGYEDANDADRLRYDPAFQILADQPLGEPLGSQPTLSRWENSPSPRELLKLQDALVDWFVKICGKQVRKRGEILLDVDSTDDPTYGQQQLSFFNGGYDQHMYHPLLIFDRHTGRNGRR